MAWYIGAQQSYDDVSSEITFKWPFSEEEVVVIDITFAYSGTAVFYTTGSGLDDSGNVYDTYGFLRESAEDVDGYTGFPGGDGMSSDDDGNDYNFRIEYDVEADRTYYLYVRHHSAVSYGDITVKIVPPDGSGDEYYQPSYDDMEVDASADGTTITVHVTGFDEDYDGVWEILYIVDEKDTGEHIVARTLRSDSDLSFDKVTFDSMDGIAPGTTYQIYVVLTPYPGVDSGVFSWFTWEPYEITTGSGDDFGAYIEFGSNTGTTITVSVKGLDTSYNRNDRYIYWSIDGVEKSPVSLSSGVPQSNSYTFTGLSPSTSYTIGARITYTSGGTTYEKYLETVSCSTANWASEQQSGLGTISSTKTTNWTLRKATIFYASVKFSQSGSVTISSSGSYDTYGYLTTGTPAFDNSTGIPSNFVAENDDFNNNQNFSITYTVEAGVTYYIWVRGYSNTTSVGYITLNIIYSNRPATFQWADGKTTKTSGQTFDITAGEWCDLLDNINAVRKYKGYSEFPKGSYTETYYYNYFTYPTSGQPFRYQHYNQALNAITGMLGDGYDDNAVKQKDPVTAAKINLLVSWLNGIT